MRRKKISETNTLSKLEIFTILKTAYFENSEITGDQLWLKLSEAVYDEIRRTTKGGGG